MVCLLCVLGAPGISAAPPDTSSQVGSPGESPWTPPRLDELDHLSSAEGLSHSTVWQIFQDSRGFMWFVTSAGLDRYDGYRFESFQHDLDDDESLVSDRVRAIAEDPSGTLWIGTAAGLDRYDSHQQRFVHYRADPNNDTSLRDSNVFDVAIDGQGRLWVATAAGLDLYRPESDGFDSIGSQSEAVAGLPVLDNSSLLELAADGTFWVTAGGSLCRLLEATDVSFTCVELESGSSKDESPVPSDMAVDLQGRVWLSTFADGVFMMDPATLQVTPFHHDPQHPGSLGGDQAMSVWADSKGQIWVGSDSSGLYLFDAGQQSFVRYVSDPFLENGLSDNGVLDIFEDRQGLLWFGTYLGVDRYDPSREGFRTVRRHPEDTTRLAGSGVWAIHLDEADELWVGTYTEGIERFDSTGRRLRVYGPDPSNAGALRNGVVSAFVEDGENGLWVGTWGGLHHFDRDREVFVAHTHQEDDPTSLASDRVYHLFRDSRGGLWISLLLGGVDYLPADRRQDSPSFVHYPSDPPRVDDLQGSSVYQTLEDHRGDLWFATSHGLERLDREAGTFQLVTPDEQAAGEEHLTQALFEDGDHVLWVGTDGQGLGRLDAQRTSFRRYHRKDGLPSELITAILGDDDGLIWLSTGEGLVRFDPKTEVFQTFDVGDGLQGQVYTVGSYFRSPAGELFFGGAQGYDRFYPRDIETDRRAPTPVLTDFSLFNRSAKLQRNDAASPLLADIGSLDRLTLSHRDYVFGFEFSGLHFASPERNRFAYQLQGFDPEWVETGPDRRFAQYSNLPAGDYVFHVKAANEDGVWSPESALLSLTVLPALWRTWWAYFLYILAVAATLAFYVRSQRRKIAYEQAVNAQLRDVNRMKDEFLANTSHELRTPLFGIIGITESLLEGVTGRLPAGTRQNLSLISASAKRLGALVNDILDFSKLSGRELQLQQGPVDLRSLCDVVLALSVPLVGSKELEVRNAVPEDLPVVDADEARLHQILINLVGNAIKFTEAGWVEVSAFVDGERVEVQVIDTGIGVPEAARESIFRAFEQGDASTERQFGGTGLGLAVTKKLVVLHGGTIGVRTAADGGAEFFFTLPISADPSLQETSTPQIPVAVGQRVSSRPPLEAFIEPEMSTELAIDLPPGELKILIVDDEPVNRQVLRNHLALEQFIVEAASSGPEALRIIDQGWLPDLILLDVMMPKMSGYEVCHALRERFPAVELPILFLTAKNQPEDQVAGLAYGANDYLTKPITKGELLARVKLHLELLWVHRHLEEVVNERTAQVKALGGLLPICGICKSVRDDTGYWNQLEDYLRQTSDAMVTHGICPSCLKDNYGELFEDGELPLDS